MQAVARGLGWIERFLASAKNLDAIGDDAPCLYFEMYFTCGDARVALRCKELCARVLRRRARQLLRSAADAGSPQREHFMESMFMLRIYKELGEANMSEGIPSLLLELADQAYNTLGFKNTEVLFGGSVESLERRRGDPDFYMVLLEMMVIEYNSILFKGRWPLQDGYGLKEGIEALKGYSYKSAQESSDDFYLVTHIVFALSAYSSIKVRESAAPSLFAYTRKSLRSWMKLARRDPFHTDIDVDGVAECADLLRGAGMTESSDAELCEATVREGRGQSDLSAYSSPTSATYLCVTFYLYPPTCLPSVKSDLPFSYAATRRVVEGRRIDRPILHPPPCLGGHPVPERPQFCSGRTTQRSEAMG